MCEGRGQNEANFDASVKYSMGTRSPDYFDLTCDYRPRLAILVPNYDITCTVMNAFVTPFAAAAPTASRPRALCAPMRPAAPFFASAAFGAPVVTRAAVPAARAPMRMDVTVVVGDNEPVESGTLAR